MKYNDNMGGVMGGEAAQAFTHFTWEASDHQEMVCDMQGVAGGVYTDALLHTVDGEAYGGGRHGNRGKRGIQDFLDTHKCGTICGTLGLPAVEGCYVDRAQKKKKKKCQQCTQCGRGKDWDADFEACWKCDREFLNQAHMDAMIME